jgi:hypothetical protein
VRARKDAIVRNDINAAENKKWIRYLEYAEVMGLRGASAEREVAPTSLPSTGSIELKLRAHLRDLTALLENHPKRATPIALTGTITIDGTQCDIRDGTLTLFPTTGSTRRRLIEYQLGFDLGAPYTLYAFKLIEDDPRLDVWQDTATLYTAIEDPSQKVSDNAGKEAIEHAGKQAIEYNREIRRGILRVPANKFLKQQVKSLTVTGTTDDERRMWALAAFATFFFGNLAATYLPELKRLPAVLRNMLMRTHG